MKLTIKYIALLSAFTALCSPLQAGWADTPPFSWVAGPLSSAYAQANQKMEPVKKAYSWGKWSTEKAVNMFGPVPCGAAGLVVAAKMAPTGYSNLTIMDCGLLAGTCYLAFSKKLGAIHGDVQKNQSLIKANGENIAKLEVGQKELKAGQKEQMAKFVEMASGLNAFRTQTGKDLTDIKGQLTGLQGEVQTLRTDLGNLREDFTDFRDSTNAQFEKTRALITTGFEDLNKNLENRTLVPVKDGALPWNQSGIGTVNAMEAFRKSRK